MIHVSDLIGKFPAAFRDQSVAITAKAARPRFTSEDLPVYSPFVQVECKAPDATPPISGLYFPYDSIFTFEDDKAGEREKLPVPDASWNTVAV